MLRIYMDPNIIRLFEKNFSKKDITKLLKNLNITQNKKKLYLFI